MEEQESSEEEESTILLRPPSEFRKEFHNPVDFLFTQELEENWKVIKEEFLNLNDQLFHPWPEQNLYKQNGEKGKGWDVFGLYAFGKKHFRNTRLCPKTTEIVERIPGMSTAAFSILTPGSRILPHVGYYGYSELVLRCHLGLIIPPKKDECFLTVGPCQQSWEDGKCMVFDDTFLHSATNNSEVTRVVLLLDFSAGELPEGCEEFVDEKPIIDQRGYLDIITAKYGYGIDPDDASS